MSLEYKRLLASRKFEVANTVRGVKIVRSSDVAYTSNIKQALDQYYYENHLLGEGNCVVCKTVTTKFCLGCGTHYCSTQCQNNDWAKHQSLCRGLMSSAESPLNESDGGMKSPFCEWKQMSHRSPDKQKGERNEYMRKKSPPKNSGNSSRRSDKLQDHSPKENKDGSDSKTFTGLKSTSSSCAVKELGHSTNSGQTTPDRGGTQRNETKIASVFQKSDAGEISVAKGKSNIQKGDILKVKRSHSVSDLVSYWVWRLEDIKSYEELQKVLEDNSLNYEVYNGQKGDLCCCKLNQSWYRGRILSTKPKLSIMCVDTGFKYYPRHSTVRKLPIELAEIEPMAFLIEFILPLSKEPDEFEIEVLDMREDGTSIVKMCELAAESKKSESGEDKTKPVTETEHKDRRRSVLDELKIKDSCVFTLMHIQGDQLYGSLLPQNEEIENYHRKIENLYVMEGDKISAEVGDLIMVVDAVNKGQRGIVQLKSLERGYKVKLIDFGYSIWTRKVYKLPESAVDAMEFGCKVTLQTSVSVRHKWEVDTSYIVDVNARLSDTEWSCSLKCENWEKVLDYVIVEKVEDYCNPDEGYIPLPSGSKVLISAFGGDSSVYVQPADEELTAQHENLHLKINELPEEKDSEFASTLRKDDMVCCLSNEDSNWYRARVLGRTNSDSIQVLFVDFGGKQVSKWSELKPLPDDMRTPPFALKVTLIGDSKTFTQRGREFIEHLIREKRELIMTYEGDISKGVLLSEEDCFDINQFIYDELPGPLPYSPVKDSFTMKFLKPKSLQQGQNNNFLILSIDEDEFISDGIFWGADSKNEEFSYVIGDLGTELSEYCNTHVEPYNPRVGELCMALYADDWYRALVTSKVDEKYQIFFVDFGNTAVSEAKCIRKMVEKFFKSPPVVVKCRLNGFNELSKEQRKSAYEFLSDQLHCVNTVKIERSSENYFVSFPKLVDLLK